jgi:hypothetical protein
MFSTPIHRQCCSRSERSRSATDNSRGITGREGGLAPAPAEFEFAKQAGASPPSQPVILTSLRGVSKVLALVLAIVITNLMASSVRAQQIVDQILTLVNDEPITRMDLLWSIAIDPQAPSPAGPVGSDLLGRKLDVMIDERLIAQEAARIPTTPITQDEIDKKRTALIKSFRNEAEFRQRVGSVGLTPQKIDEIVRERILIDRFVDFRFRSFVVVTEQEIKRYYEEILTPKVRAEGQVPPPIDGPKVRDGIIANLKQEKIEAEINRWLGSARQRADVVQLAEP